MLIFLRDFLSKILNQVLSTLAESPVFISPGQYLYFRIYEPKFERFTAAGRVLKTWF